MTVSVNTYGTVAGIERLIGDTVNFQSDQAQSPVMILRIQEIAWGVQ